MSKKRKKIGDSGFDKLSKDKNKLVFRSDVDQALSVGPESLKLNTLINILKGLSAVEFAYVVSKYFDEMPVSNAQAIARNLLKSVDDAVLKIQIASGKLFRRVSGGGNFSEEYPVELNGVSTFVFLVDHWTDTSTLSAKWNGRFVNILDGWERGQLTMLPDFPSIIGFLRSFEGDVKKQDKVWPRHFWIKNARGAIYGSPMGSIDSMGVWKTVYPGLGVRLSADDFKIVLSKETKAECLNLSDFGPLHTEWQVAFHAEFRLEGGSPPIGVGDYHFVMLFYKNLGVKWYPQVGSQDGGDMRAIGLDGELKTKTLRKLSENHDYVEVNGCLVWSMKVEVAYQKFDQLLNECLLSKFAAASRWKDLSKFLKVDKNRLYFSTRLGRALELLEKDIAVVPEVNGRYTDLNAVQVSEARAEFAGLVYGLASTVVLQNS